MYRMCGFSKSVTFTGKVDELCGVEKSDLLLSIIFLIQHNKLFRYCSVSHVTLLPLVPVFRLMWDECSLPAHSHLCLNMQICMHCRLEFIFGCLCAKEKWECVHLYVNEKERWVKRAAYAYWCVSANLLLICLIHPSVCICLMNRILRLTVSCLNGWGKSSHVYFCVHVCTLIRHGAVGLESREKGGKIRKQNKKANSQVNKEGA